jgi:hypothetical protein
MAVGVPDVDVSLNPMHGPSCGWHTSTQAVISHGTETLCYSQLYLESPLPSQMDPPPLLLTQTPCPTAGKQWMHTNKLWWGHEMTAGI